MRRQIALATRANLSNSIRSDVQVLRGIAVVAVVLYHLEVPFIRGGFLGVDIFFVISGYVITKSLANSSGTLRARISNFYKRRIRRIIPASIYVLLITFVLSLVLLPILHIRRFTFDFLASFFMVSNFGFAFQSFDYLNQAKASSPFLHYWSLAVEEQFYLVWPLLYLTLIRQRKIRLILIIVLTFGFAIISTKLLPLLSFYSPTSRAWEFLIGASINSLPNRRINKSVSFCIISVAFPALLLCILLIDSSHSLPSFLTILPVISTFLLIIVGFEFRALKIFETIGEVSFSLYLIHWPLILTSTFIFGEMNLFGKSAILVLAFSLAKLIYGSVETPWRFPDARPMGDLDFAKLTLPFLLILIAGGWIGSFETKKIGFEINTATPNIYQTGCHTRNSKIDFDHCVFGDIKSLRRVLLIGDSHAAQFFPGFDSAAEKFGFALFVATKSGCPALLNSQAQANDGCSEWQMELTKSAKLVSPDIVIISNLTEDRNYQSRIGLTDSQWISSLLRLVDELKKSSRIVYISDTPFPFRDSVGCLSLNWKSPRRCDLPDTKRSLTRKIKAALIQNRITVVDSRAFFCMNNNCPALIDGKNAYRDASHISVATKHIQESIFQDLISR